MGSGQRANAMRVLAFALASAASAAIAGGLAFVVHQWIGLPALIIAVAAGAAGLAVATASRRLSVQARPATRRAAGFAVGVGVLATSSLLAYGAAQRQDERNRDLVTASGGHPDWPPVPSVVGFVGQGLGLTDGPRRLSALFDLFAATLAAAATAASGEPR